MYLTRELTELKYGRFLENAEAFKSRRCSRLSSDGGEIFKVVRGVKSSAGKTPEVEFLNSEELSLIKSSPLPAQLPRPGRS